MSAKKSLSLKCLNTESLLFESYPLQMWHLKISSEFILDVFILTSRTRLWLHAPIFFSLMTIQGFVSKHQKRRKITLTLLGLVFIRPNLKWSSYRIFQYCHLLAAKQNFGHKLVAELKKIYRKRKQKPKSQQKRN